MALDYLLLGIELEFDIGILHACTCTSLPRGNGQLLQADMCRPINMESCSEHLDLPLT